MEGVVAPFEHRLNSRGLFVAHDEMLGGFLGALYPPQLRQLPATMAAINSFDDNAGNSKFRSSLSFCSIFEVLPLSTLFPRSFASLCSAQQRLSTTSRNVLSNRQHHGMFFQTNSISPSPASTPQRCFSEQAACAYPSEHTPGSSPCTRAPTVES